MQIHGTARARSIDEGVREDDQLPAVPSAEASAQPLALSSAGR
jgi:hypothetical protein